MSFIMLSNHHHYLSSTHFHHPNKTLYLLAVGQSLLTHLLSITNLLSVSMDLPFLDVSYKRNNICGILCLASFM